MIYLFLLAPCIVFHFQLLFIQWIYALSVSQLEKHHCLPCPGKSFGTTWVFSCKHTEQDMHERKTSSHWELETLKYSRPSLNFLSLFYYQSFQVCCTLSFQQALLKGQIEFFIPVKQRRVGKLFLKGQMVNILGCERVKRQN